MEPSKTRGGCGVTRLRRFWRRFRRTRLCLALAAFLLLAVLCGVEYLFANRLSFSLSGYSETILPLDGAILQKNASFAEGGILLGEGARIVFPNVEAETADVAVTASSGQLQIVEITVSVRDDASKEEYRTKVDGRLYTDETAFLRLRSSGEVKELLLQCNSEGPVLLTEVALNRRPPVAFSVLRVLLVYALIASLWAIRHFRLWKVMYTSRNGRHRLAVALSLYLCLATLFPLCAGAGLKKVPYEEELPNAYEQLFSAMLEGRVDLDIPFDAAELEKLENPYDYTERLPIAENGFGPFWDRAYYEGKFYCYFGVAPVLTVFFPVYLLTGLAPNSELVILLLLLMGTAALFGALLEILRYFRLRVPLLLFCLGFPALFFGALFPMIASCPDMYYVALASGLAFLSATLYFGFAALNCRRRLRRRVFFALCGLCLALTAASRPTVVLYAALLIPPFLAVLTERGRQRSEKLIDASAFCIPLVLGVLPLLWYNAVRFGSPFEFGASYQLTYGDVRQNRLSLSLIGETLMHYFLLSPQLSGHFPYLRPAALELNSYGVYFYTTPSLGALCFPLVWTGGAQGFLTKKQPVKKAVYLLALGVPFVVAFCDLCLGGVNLRYLADVLLPLLLVGLLVLLELAGRVNESYGDGTSFRFFCLAWAVLIGSFLMGFALVFANERSWIYEGSPAVFRFFENIFS